MTNRNLRFWTWNKKNGKKNAGTKDKLMHQTKRYILMNEIYQW